MNRDEFCKLIEIGGSQRAIAKRLMVSQSTVKHWLKKYGLKTMHNQFNSKCVLRCKCGETDKSKFYRNGDDYMRGLCKKCHNKSAVERFRKYKAEAVDYKGGKCEVCGYDKCLGSMDFHHKDPSLKDPKWKQMRTWKFDRLKDELDKCMLVCRNCHGEIHYDASVT